MVRSRIRIRFKKTGDLRFIGHRDLMRCFYRLLRRADIHPALSLGFHPKPKVSFPAALPLGVIGLNEIVELEIDTPITAEYLQNQLNFHAFQGLTFTHTEILPDGAGKAHPKEFSYEIQIPTQRCAALQDRMIHVNSKKPFMMQRVDREKSVDIHRALIEMSLSEDAILRFSLRADVSDGAGCNPRDILQALELLDLECAGGVLIRNAVLLEDHIRATHSSTPECKT